LLATTLILTLALGFVGYYVYAALSTNVKVPSSGTLVPLPTDPPTPSPSPTLTPTASLSIRETNGAVLNQIYWGDHLTIHDAPTHQVMIENTGSVPLTLSMAASTPTFATVTWDGEGKTVPANGFVVATLKLSFYQAVNSQTIPFNADITITGNSA
jgi:hypothetical protein